MTRFQDLFSRKSGARLFFLAHAQSSLGTGAGYVALLVLAYKRFPSPWAVALVLLADFFPHGEVAQKYGVFYPNGVTHRAVIGIDKEGIVRYIDDHAPLEVPELEACAIALGK